MANTWKKVYISGVDAESLKNTLPKGLKGKIDTNLLHKEKTTLIVKVPERPHVYNTRFRYWLQEYKLPDWLAP